MPTVDGHTIGRFLTCWPERRPASGGVASKAAPHAEIRRFFNGMEGAGWPHSASWLAWWHLELLSGGPVRYEGRAVGAFLMGWKGAAGHRVARPRLHSHALPLHYRYITATPGADPVVDEPLHYRYVTDTIITAAYFF